MSPGRWWICGICLLPQSLFAIEGNKWTLNGYFNFIYNQQLSDKGLGDEAGTFDVEQISLIYNFNINNKARIASNLVWEHSHLHHEVASETGEAGGEATAGEHGDEVGEIEVIPIEWVFFEYAAKNWLKFRVGKFNNPIGIYNETHLAAPSFYSVAAPLATNQPTKLSSEAVDFFPARSAGVMLKGVIDMSDTSLEYDLLLSNGGVDSGPNDSGKDKAVSARVTASMLEGYKLGLSYYKDSDYAKEINANKITTVGAQFEANIHALTLQAETLMATIKGDDTARKQTAYYLQLAYTVEKFGLTPYLRYEFLDPNKDIEANEASSKVLGINYELTTDVFLKLEGVNISGKDQTAGLGALDDKQYNQIKAAIAVGF